MMEVYVGGSALEPYLLQFNIEVFWFGCVLKGIVNQLL